VQSHPDYTLNGTLGQGAIGIVGGLANIHEIGFWYSVERELPARVESEDVLPSSFSLRVSCPNPTDEASILRFAVPSPSDVEITLHDVTGRAVRKIVDGPFEPGNHDVTLHANGLAGGIYFVRMSATAFVATRRLILLR
jgi:hypothetical protein